MEKAVSSLTKGGLFTALGVILIYLSIILPTSNLFLLLVASAVIPISVLTTGVKNSYIVFFSTSMLSFLTLGIKLQTILYLVFFGIYALVKAHIEKLHSLPLELLLKFIFFNFSFALTYLAYKTFLFNINIRFSFIVLYGTLMLAAFIADYALTIYISELRKILNRIKKST